MPVRLEGPLILLSEARAEMLAAHAVSLENQLQELALQGVLEVSGYKYADAEMGDRPEELATIPTSELLHARWDWDQSRLSLEQDLGDWAPTIQYGYVRCALSRAEFREWIGQVSGIAQNPERRGPGRPPAYKQKDLDAILDELDQPRGHKSQGALAREVADAFQDRHNLTLSIRTCERAIKNERGRSRVT